jgi:predicted N-acetyltransferase YhbS
VISAKAREKIVGAVRLSPESGVLVLRGMQITPSYQRQEIGTRMLREVAKFMGSRECSACPILGWKVSMERLDLPRLKMATLRVTFAKGLPNIRRNVQN